MIGIYNYTVILTYVGFASGVSGILLAISDHPTMAIIALLFCGLCDAFDGRVARTKERNEDEKRFGIQIDSLSDLVCFGILPAVIGYQIGMKQWWQIGIIIVYTLASLIRLAFFNVLEEKKKNDSSTKMYHGLPITCASLIFPVFYAVKLLTTHIVGIYSTVMLITAIAMITDFKIRKPGLKGVLILIAIGIAELLFVLAAKRWIF